MYNKKQEINNIIDYLKMISELVHGLVDYCWISNQ
jgi:hypothetical protein